MAVILGSNISSLKTQRRISESSKELSQTFTRLSSGLRINSASDDAAGLAVASNLNADARVYNQAVRNLNDGISYLNVAHGALSAMSGILIRLQELSEQAANGSYSSNQRSSLNREATSLTAEYNRIVETTKFNNIAIFDATNSTVRVQGGYDTAESLQIGIGTTLATRTGNGNFIDYGDISIGTGAGDANDVTVGDFNSDGYDDILVSVNNQAATAVLISNGDGTFRTPVTYATGGVDYLATGDFNNDNIIDFVGNNNDGNRLTVMFGVGDGTFGSRISFNTVNGGGGQHVTGDLNGDSYDDIIWGTSGGGTSGVWVALSNGNGTFLASVSYGAGTQRRSMAIGDIDGNGTLDVIAAGDSVFLGVGDGTLQNPYSAGAGVISQLFGAQLADVNGDGKLDLISGENGSRFKIVLGNGDGTFKPAISIASATTSTYDPQLADFNDDGVLDVVFGGDTGNSVNVHFGNGNGTFKSAVTFSSGTTTQTVAVGDFDGNGVTDIVAGNEDSFDVSILMGDYVQRNTIDDIDLTTQALAREGLTTTQNNLARVSTIIAQIGAQLARLEATTQVLGSRVAEYKGAQDRIMSIDVAEEAAKLIRSRIMQQTATAVLKQTNILPELALGLLRD